MDGTTMARRDYSLETTVSGRFAQLLENEYNRFSMLFYFQEKRKATMADFAQYLGVQPASLDDWMQRMGRPSEAEVRRFPKELAPSAHRILFGL